MSKMDQFHSQTKTLRQRMVKSRKKRRKRKREDKIKLLPWKRRVTSCLHLMLGTLHGLH